MVDELKPIFYIVIILLLLIWFWISSTKSSYLEKTLTDVAEHFNGHILGISAIFKVSDIEIEFTIVQGKSNKYNLVKPYVLYKIKSDNKYFRDRIKFKKNNLLDRNTPIVVKDLIKQKFDLITVYENHIEIIFYQGLFLKKIDNINWIKKTDDNIPNFSKLIMAMSKT